jgi:short-subunit dehydrogenase
MKRDFVGRTVVVTGGSAGTGLAIAHAFARRGAGIGLVARGQDRLEAAARDLRSRGTRVAAVRADVADPEQLEHAASEIENELGPISVWINNAMVSAFGPYQKLSAAEYRRVTEVTYLGQVYGTGVALKRMQPRGEGSIVLIGSALAYRGIPLQSAYCGAKHAIHGFFETLRAELIEANSGVHLAMVQLPAMNTPQFEWVKNYMSRKPRPMGTVYQPEVAAEAVVDVVRTKSRERIVGASTLEAIWGNKLFPGLMDQYLAITGYEGQLTSEAEEPGRPDNLWEPVPGAYGIHGTFGAEAKQRTFTQWMSSHKRLGLAASLGLLVVASVAFGALRKGR